MYRRRLRSNPINVLVQSFKQIPQELLRVLLRVPHESRCESLYLRLQRDGIDDAIATIFGPHFLDDLAERLDEGTLHAGDAGVDIDGVGVPPDVLQ